VLFDALGFIIDDGGTLAGSTRLRTLDPLHRRAVLELTLVDGTKLDQGIIRRAVALMLDHAFDTLDLHRVSLRCLETNKRALTCYESSGFRREGVEREAVRLGDMWHDVLLLAKLARDHRP
jgi:RimJ/RimL family protein N-acetyltransferase